jgi:hypothetical protein
MKGLVLALFAAYWVAVIVIWIAARSVFDQVGGLPRGQVGAEASEVLVLSALLMLLSVGIVRGWLAAVHARRATSARAEIHWGCAPGRARHATRTCGLRAWAQLPAPFAFCSSAI